MFHQAKLKTTLGFLLLSSFAFSKPAFRELSQAELNKLLKEPCAFLHVWATWCEPCVEELPRLLKFLGTQKKIKPVIVDVTPETERKTISTKLINSISPSFDTFYKPPGSDEAYVDSIDKTWGGSLPYSIFYKAGKIQKKWTGPLELKDLEKSFSGCVSSK